MPIFPAFSVAMMPHRLAQMGARLAVPLLVLGLAAGSVMAGDLEDASQSLKSGQHAKALDQIDRHLSSKPKDVQGRFLKGIILTGLNKQSDAITVFKKLTEDYPELPEPYNNLAVIYAQQKQYEKAKEALEMAIRTHPAYATAHENLGDIYSRLASQAYGKALQIDSSNSSAQTKLSMINDLVGGTTGKGTGKATGTPTAIAPAVVASAKPEVKPVEAKPIDTKPMPPAKPEVKVEPKPEPKAEPKPEVKAEAKPETKANPAGMESEVTAAVDTWLSAWSRKDVKTYLAAYAKDFDTPGNASRKDWEADRTQKVGKPGKIEVTRDNLSVKIEGSDKATVRFRQNYKSASFNSSSAKTLVLVKRDGKWLIQQERVGG